MSDTRGKRLRRTAKQKLAYGSKAKRAHRRRGGRTGAVRSKQTPSAKRLGAHTVIPATAPAGVTLLADPRKAKP